MQMSCTWSHHAPPVGERGRKRRRREVAASGMWEEDRHYLLEISCLARGRKRERTEKAVQSISHMAQDRKGDTLG